MKVVSIIYTPAMEHITMDRVEQAAHQALVAQAIVSDVAVLHLQNGVRGKS
jgi:hypothetical protein